jgi:hypothetical protein
MLDPANPRSPDMGVRMRDGCEPIDRGPRLNALHAPNDFAEEK